MAHLNQHGLSSQWECAWTVTCPDILEIRCYHTSQFFQSMSDRLTKGVKAARTSFNWLQPPRVLVLPVIFRSWPRNLHPHARSRQERLFRHPHNEATL